MSQLSAQQQRFVEEYLIDLNGGQAAKRAGYSDAGGGHYQNASRLLRNVNVSSAIDAALAKRGEKLGLKAERIVAELMRIAFADHRNVMSWDDARGLVFRSSDTLDDDTAAAIAEISEKAVPTRDGGMKREQKIKMHDKNRALELLGKHLGMWNADAGDGANPMATFHGMLASGQIDMNQVVEHLSGKKA